MFEVSSLSGISKEAVVFLYFISISAAVTIYTVLNSKLSVAREDNYDDSDSEYDTTDRNYRSSDSEDDVMEGANTCEDINDTLYGSHGLSEEDNERADNKEDESTPVRKYNKKLISIDTRVLLKIKEKIGSGVQDLAEMNDTITRELRRLGLITKTINRELNARDKIGSFSEYSLEDLYNGLKVKKEGIESEDDSRWMELALEEIMRRRVLG